VLVGQLQRVDDTEKFGGVTTRAGGVVDEGTDDLLGVDEEDGADGQGHTLGVDVGGILVVDHVVQVGNFAGLVRDDGVLDGGVGDFVDILNPFLVGFEGVGTQADELDIALVEFRLEFGNSTELEAISIRVANSEGGMWEEYFGCADGGKVFGMGEQDGVRVANVLVELDGPLCGVYLKVRGDAAQPQLLLLNAVDCAAHLLFLCGGW
jgi:hypothetical protein